MKNKHYIMIVILLTVSNVYGTVLTFDDITSDVGTKMEIPAEYGGLGWKGFYLAYVSDYEGPYGYGNSLVSGDYVIWGLGEPDYPYGGDDNPPSLVLELNYGFDFTGVYLTAGQVDNLNVQVIGYNDDLVIYDQTVVLDMDQANWFEFNYYGINQLRFFADNNYFVMDNFTYEIIPEPATILLLGLGTLAVVRKKNNFYRTRAVLVASNN